jgi:plasmid stabilization system protein ParE
LIRYTAAARRELGGKLAYLAADNADAADRLEVDVLLALQLLDAGGVDGPELVLRDGRRVRRWLVPPLALYYVRNADGVLVVRVRHGAQRPITRQT